MIETIDTFRPSDVSFDPNKVTITQGSHTYTLKEGDTFVIPEGPDTTVGNIDSSGMRIESPKVVADLINTSSSQLFLLRPTEGVLVGQPRGTANVAVSEVTLDAALHLRGVALP